MPQNTILGSIGKLDCSSQYRISLRDAEGRGTQRDRSDKKEVKKTRLELGWRVQEVLSSEAGEGAREQTNGEGPESRKSSAKQSATGVWRETTKQR
jgi:hypothetical protein